MPQAQAETYKGISPLDSLSDLKAKFPGATFKREHPAWAQENDVMYSITGEGMSGTIVVNFYDDRPYWRQLLSEEQDETKKEALRSLANTPDDEITVSTVRWVPDYPFPVSRLITKYGKPDRSDFSEDNYQAYKEWTSRRMRAYLTDDAKNVMRIDFGFTDKERQDAWKKKFGFVPNSLSKEKKGKKK